MGDGSAARHQGGLFSSIGKALRRAAGVVAAVVPGPVGVIAKLASSAASPRGLAGTLAAQFAPQIIPGAPIMSGSSSNPLAVPVSTPPAILSVAHKPRTKVRTTRRRTTTRTTRRRYNAATRARLRNLGYRV